MVRCGSADVRSDLLERRLVDRYFRLAQNSTSVRQELLGGVTTFVTMAYVVVVNPQILSQAGMPADGVVRPWPRW